MGRTGEHSELTDLASFLVSDRAGYINGEMVVIDGGAHLRSSGAEDLLRWTDAQWAEQRAARTKSEVSHPLTSFPNWTFPVIPATGTKRGRAIFQSQY